MLMVSDSGMVSSVWMAAAKAAALTYICFLKKKRSAGRGGHELLNLTWYDTKKGATNREREETDLLLALAVLRHGVPVAGVLLCWGRW